MYKILIAVLGGRQRLLWPGDVLLRLVVPADQYGVRQYGSRNIGVKWHCMNDANDHCGRLASSALIAFLRRVDLRIWHELVDTLNIHSFVRIGASLLEKNKALWSMGLGQIVFEKE